MLGGNVYVPGSVVPEQETSSINWLYPPTSGGNNSGNFLFHVSNKMIVLGGSRGIVASMFIILVKETLYLAKTGVLQLSNSPFI